MTKISESMDDVARNSDKTSEALVAQEGILEEFIGRTDVRFEAIVAEVEGMEEWRATVDERLDALERNQAG